VEKSLNFRGGGTLGVGLGYSVDGTANALERGLGVFRLAAGGFYQLAQQRVELLGGLGQVGRGVGGVPAVQVGFDD
jgi:hypothetical protein